MPVADVKKAHCAFFSLNARLHSSESASTNVKLNGLRDFVESTRDNTDVEYSLSMKPHNTYSLIHSL